MEESKVQNKEKNRKLEYTVNECQEHTANEKWEKNVNEKRKQTVNIKQTESKRKKKISKNDRKAIRNISSVGDGTSRAYRQKLIVEQMGKLVDEVEKNRREEQAAQTDGVIRQKVIKRKNTRIAYRIAGAAFVIIGILFVWWAMAGHYRVVKSAVGVAAIAYGFYVIRASFKSSAYDMTFLFGQDVITVLQKSGSKVIPYGRVTGYTMIEPDPEMKYYIIKFDCGKNSYIVPFAGAKSKCEAVYEMLEKRSGKACDE